MSTKSRLDLHRLQDAVADGNNQSNMTPNAAFGKSFYPYSADGLGQVSGQLRLWMA